VKARALAVLLTSTLLLLACASGREPSRPIAINAAEMAAFADGFFSRQMRKHHIPGMVFVFVQGGELVYAQGYGLANLETNTPMDAAETVMRIGSVSKTFVATAAMQLVEQGQLDLHADINQYLISFQLEETYPEPVTLAHLLTHRSGFEDPLYVSNTDPETVEPLGEHLAHNMPARAHPPGEQFIYSNYAYALAGLVVEEVSGLPLDEYCEQHIFGPLGMTQTQYLVRPPAPAGIATGYQYVRRDQVVQPLDWDSDYPSGSIVSTAGDMARYLLGHLGGGCCNEGCILRPETVALMHGLQAETGYAGQNVTYGFVEGRFDGVRMVGHSGAIRGFGNSLNLLPEHDLGYFFSFNEECNETIACEIIGEFREQFVKAFF
jgi:CubicO group peptidase (beta-lactamase class C family)